MKVLTSDDFVPTGRPQKMRGLYKKVKNAVNKVLVETWREGLAFIVTKETAAKIAESSGALQFNTVSWAPKKDKPQGRNICDSSDDSAGNAINSSEAAAKLEELYGKIEHPTLQELVEMINNFADEKREEMGSAFKWEDVCLWKGDLRKAFTLLNVRPGDVRLFACELSDGLVLFYHSGLFGWTGTPYCFQVVTRVVQRLVQARVKGRMKMFVDDGMGVTMKKDLQHDLDVMREVAEELLGPLAIADDKWEWGRRLTWIGWDIDLDKERVTISRHEDSVRSLLNRRGEGSSARTGEGGVLGVAILHHTEGHGALQQGALRRNDGYDEQVRVQAPTEHSCQTEPMDVARHVVSTAPG
jgi:hypothetical protein